VIDIQDARFPGRILYRGTIPASDDDRHYSIVPDQPAPRIKLQRLAKPTPPRP